MLSYVDMTVDMPKGLKRFRDKYIDFGMKLEKQGKYTGKWKSNNVKEVKMKLCALVSGNRKVKKTV
jgi:hypothetical protein